MGTKTLSNKVSVPCNGKKILHLPCTSLSEHYLSQTPSSFYLSAFFVGLSKVIVSKHDYMDRYFVRVLLI